MKIIVVVLFCLLISSPIAQVMDQQVWVETGVKYNISKKLSSSFDVTQRYGYKGLGTLFPQLSVRYKVNSWLRPSLDYRIILSKSLDGTYTSSQRINGNLQFSYAKNGLEFGFRVRYQYRFERINSAYDSEFDHAFRFKPSVEYTIKGTPLTPTLSTELFYNPENSANGKQFNRARYFGGITIDLPHKQHVSVGIYYDKSINIMPKSRIMYGLAYQISLAASKSKKKSTTKNLRDL